MDFSPNSSWKEGEIMRKFRKKPFNWARFWANIIVGLGIYMIFALTVCICSLWEQERRIIMDNIYEIDWSAMIDQAFEEEDVFF